MNDNIKTVIVDGNDTVHQATALSMCTPYDDRVYGRHMANVLGELLVLHMR